MRSELNSVDYFVLNALLDDIESADSIFGHWEGVSSRPTLQEIEESLQKLIAHRLVDRVEDNQETKTWDRFSDYKKDHWFDLTEKGRAVALQNSAK